MTDDKPKVAMQTDLTSVEVIQVVHTQTRMGTGIVPDPIRIVHEYWSMDGMRLAYYDPCEAKP